MVRFALTFLHSLTKRPMLSPSPLTAIRRMYIPDGMAETSSTSSPSLLETMNQRKTSSPLTSNTPTASARYNPVTVSLPFVGLG